MYIPLQFMKSIFQTVMMSIALVAVASCSSRSSKPLPQQSIETLPDVTFSADSAYNYVAQQCAFGPRVPGTDAHAQCLEYLTTKMRSFGAEVSVQEGEGTAYDGSRVAVKNVICSFRADRVNRVLLCAHWDSRPWADHDADKANYDKPISGANDGASGVGVLMEIGRQLQAKAPHIGVDIIFFDTEDGGLPDHKSVERYIDAWCIGSTYWSTSELGKNAEHRYGVLLDMVGDKDAVFPMEQFSKQYAYDVLDKVWTIAEAKGHADRFSRTEGSYITDDHVPVNKNTKVPMIDILHYNSSSKKGFCKTWHTQQDVIENISKESLAAVGETLLTVIYAEK